MIIGVDHVSLSVTDISKAISYLEPKGFICKFMEMDVLNNPAKKPLLSRYKARHDFALFVPRTPGPSIEAINHGCISSCVGAFDYMDDYIVIKTNDIQQEQFFWEQVFSFKDIGGGFFILKGLTKNLSCKVMFVEEDNVSSATLDSEGYACMAFLTNNLLTDVNQLLNNGAMAMTSPFTICSNGYMLDVVMFRTPGGAICELIQLKS